MELQYCPACGAFLETPITGPLNWQAEAIVAWHAEIAATCQHDPHCNGPWQHAVRAIRESCEHGQKTDP
ncbi:MAG TPA: hypothetical protein VNM37_15230 [Candidatus Dormibacteraeota bacterium]|nr:hypothetical protein [Candidatus Dormibacteraeota bacterium]